MQCRIRSLVIALLFTASAGLAAIERGPLPVVELTNIDGGTALTSLIAREGPWLILVVRPGCEPCEAILKAATPHDHPGLGERLVVIVTGGTRDDLQSIADRHPDVPRTAWYTDHDATMFSRLRLSGVPVAIGVRGKTVEWSLSGVLADSRAVGSVLGSWVARP